MIGYRSIGTGELCMLLFARNPIYGQTCWDELRENTCPSLPYGTVCFFKDKRSWLDKQHSYDIVVELPDNPAVVFEGQGTYLTGTDFATKGIWNGRTGKNKVVVDELYTRFYTAEQVKELHLHGHFADWYIKSKIRPVCDEFGIELFI